MFAFVAWISMMGVSAWSSRNIILIKDFLVAFNWGGELRRNALTS